MPRKPTALTKKDASYARARGGSLARPVRRRRVDTIQAVEALQTANEYCLRHYAIGYTGGIPRRLALAAAQVWVVPVLLTSPGYGVVGDVGIVAVDAFTREIVGSTPRAEVLAAGARLAAEKRDELDAAFRRARTV